MSERKLHGAVVAVALALPGCAGTHVGDDWQCPLSQGAVCASVAAADPAVPKAKVPEGGVPPRRARAGAPETEAAAPDRDCDAGCSPLAWIARLLAGGADPSSPAVPETAIPPGEESTGSLAAGPSPAPEDLSGVREPETVGRMWIAPFVDAGGIYREGALVCFVIAPARWKLK